VMTHDIPSLKGPVGGSFLLYLDVTDIDRLYERVADRAEVVVPMTITPYGMREFYITDPHGYVLGFAQPAGDAAEVNR
jgi:uncharacterized glyoxalase superfamily protein PhnB